MILLFNATHGLLIIFTEQNLRNKEVALEQNLSNLFNALGDPLRLLLITKLAQGKACSISTLTVGTSISRQAISKHLLVLENIGLVKNIKQGRESLYQLNPQPLNVMQKYLDSIAAEWDDALIRNELPDFI